MFINLGYRSCDMSKLPCYGTGKDQKQQTLHVIYGRLNYLPLCQSQLPSPGAENLLGPKVTATCLIIIIILYGVGACGCIVYLCAISFAVL